MSAPPTSEPRDLLATCWTGKAAEFLSAPGAHGPVPCSELAMHCRIAGKQVQRYALFTDRENRINWAAVEIAGRRTPTEGLPAEVLPWEVRPLHNLE